MATFKAVVEPHYKRADGTYNIRIRVTHKRRSKLLSTQYYVTADDMTRKLKIKNETFIDATNELIKKYRDACNRAGDKLNSMTVEQVVDIIQNNYDPSATFDLDFIDFGRSVATKLMNDGRVGNSRSYTVALNSLVRFVGRDKVNINEITAKFLQSYVDWINASPARENREKGGRAASLYLSCIRALHNMAKAEYNDEDMGVIRIPFSPFAKFKLPRVPQSRKRALSVEQIQKLISIPYRPRHGQEENEFNRFNLAKDVFLLSFGLVGMNSVDLFNCTSYKSGRITYNRTKTKNRRADKAEISIKVESQIKALFEKYRDKTGERVFNFYQHYSNANTFNWNVNKLLKEIGKCIEVDDLELYAARHSWATIARNDAKTDMYTVHTALNHVDEKMKVTDIYIKKDNSIIDDANKSVLKLFDFLAFETKEPSKQDKEVEAVE